MVGTSSAGHQDHFPEYTLETGTVADSTIQALARPWAGLASIELPGQPHGDAGVDHQKHEKPFWTQVIPEKSGGALTAYIFIVIRNVQKYSRDVT